MLSGRLKMANCLRFAVMVPSQLLLSHVDDEFRRNTDINLLILKDTLADG